MLEEARFKAAFPYQKDVLALPVTDIDAAARWYSKTFGMIEVERRHEPTPTVILVNAEVIFPTSAEVKIPTRPVISRY
jgi:catechol 2,3-dioxygenase-like lactoylglutathione lyase family enzyme